MTIKLIGHRGNGRTTDTPFAEGKAPQHTLRSFTEAIAHGAEGVEFDVFLTRDRVPVVVDNNMVFGHTISMLDCADVRAIAITHEDNVPTLEQVLILLKDLNDGRAADDRLFVSIELKGPGVVEPTLDVISGVAKTYGFERDTVYFSATDRDKLALVREKDKNAHIQPTILTTELFNPALIQQPGFHVSRKEEYNRVALGNLGKFIRDKGCCAIDTPTGDIRKPLIDLADKLGVGFCTHPTGPRREIEAKRIFHTIGLLEEFARTAQNRVVMKVDDIAAARDVIAARKAHAKTPFEAMERMMGMPFLRIR
jgi:glycerophosphoryl diester phosphodiesterase